MPLTSDTSMRILVVRLSALGDIVHTLPVVAALRREFPDAEIDWLVEERFREMVDLVPVVDRAIGLPRSGVRSWAAAWRICHELRRRRYDVAIDVQGLLKSAVAARLPRPGRVVGFAASNLREPAARWMYTESVAVSAATHVIAKNLSLVSSLLGGAEQAAWEFPIEVRDSVTSGDIRERLGLSGREDFALLNPGTAWPSKCWDPVRYAHLAQRLWEAHRLRSAVSWGPGEEARGRAVSDASSGAAVLLPATGITDLVSYVRAAAVVVAGDTGPLHLAAAVGTPVVGIYGPSDPERNGPWSSADEVVSRCSTCRCRIDRQQHSTRGVIVRRCEQPRRCLDEVEVDEIVAAVERRLGWGATDA